MADSKLSALTEATTLGTTDELYVNDSGTSKRITAANAGTALIAAAGVTSSAAELNLIDGSVAGTAVASKALVLGADKNVDTLAIADGGLKLGAGAGTAVTSTAAELNVLDGIPATLTATELGYVDGVTSAIQTQIDGKQATITGAATTVVSSNLTASRALISDPSGKIAVSAVIDATELSYLNGVTSAIQTQIDSKLAATATSIGTHTKWIPAKMMDSAADTFTEGSGGPFSYKLLDAATTSVYFPVAFEKSWNEGTITVQIYWQQGAAGAGNVVFSVGASAFSNDDAYSSPTGSVTVTDAGGTQSDIYVTDISGAVTISGSPAAGDLCQFIVSRLGSDGSDTLGATINLIGVKIIYTTDAGTDA